MGAALAGRGASDLSGKYGRCAPRKPAFGGGVLRAGIASAQAELPPFAAPVNAVMRRRFSPAPRRGARLLSPLRLRAFLPLVRAARRYAQAIRGKTDRRFP